MNFKNKTVLITGSSRGIGKAAALLFAEQGANVVINYVSSKKGANSVVNEIKKSGLPSLAIKCDVSNKDQVKEMFKKTYSEFGNINILVNNAGAVIDVSFKDRTVNHWVETLNLNLVGTYLCSKYVLPYMKKGGKIVNVASTSGTTSFSPDSIDYDSSKAGVIALTKNLAQELAPDILVNSISPGWVDTDMNKGLPKTYIKSEMDKIYLKRMARPEEVANAILFLASNKASYITGIDLVIDGGTG